jgi:hypothetical protein
MTIKAAGKDGGDRGERINIRSCPLRLLLGPPEWITARQILNRNFADKGLEPPGALFHPIFFRRDVAEDDQAFFLSCRNCVARIFNRFPIEPRDHRSSRGKAITIYVLLTLAYDRAQIENTVLDVGAIGPAAEEIEILLRQ